VIGYRFLPPAEEEMTEAAIYYDGARSGLDADLLHDIQYAISAVRRQPEVGTNLGYGFRRVLVRRFPFSVVYFLDDGEVVVAAIAHHRRRPRYWVERA